MERTFEEVLREKMAQSVTTRDPQTKKVKIDERTGEPLKIMPMEAMVMAVMNNAMKGDIGSILFIRGLTERRREDSDEWEEKTQKRLQDTIEELRQELKGQRFSTDEVATELEMLARQLVVLREVADITTEAGHQHIQVTPQKDGTSKSELSTTNKIFNDLWKQWKTDWRELQDTLFQIERKKQILKR